MSVGTCGVIVGRLVAHPCGTGGATPCQRCNTLACKHHRDKAGLCGVCSGKIPGDRPAITVTAEEMFRFQDADAAAFDPAAGGGRDRLSALDS